MDRKGYRRGWGDGGYIPDETIQFDMTLDHLYWMGLAQGLIPRMISTLIASVRKHFFNCYRSRVLVSRYIPTACCKQADLTDRLFGSTYRHSGLKSTAPL
jgi:hypothetical protein